MMKQDMKRLITTPTSSDGGNPNPNPNQPYLYSNPTYDKNICIYHDISFVHYIIL